MCSIAGWIDFTRDLGQERVVVDAMACRGPDDERVWIDRHAAIGHRRLSVIDLEGGRQPMTAEESGRTLAVLTFSGEIYNYRELRSDLASRGHHFRTRSDTEVVLRGYLEWGEGVVDKLNGMFAFAVWDVRTQELLLVGDRMGIKPLYYYPTADGVLFGSEPKAILAHPDIPRRINTDGLRELLDMVKTPEHAIFTGMHEVRPGHIIRVRREGLVKRCDWALKAREHTDNLKQTIDTVRGLLEDTVSRQLISDVPLCSLLSGRTRLLVGREQPVKASQLGGHAGRRLSRPVRTAAGPPCGVVSSRRSRGGVRRLGGRPGRYGRPPARAPAAPWRAR